MTEKNIGRLNQAFRYSQFVYIQRVKRFHQFTVLPNEENVTVNNDNDYDLTLELVLVYIVE